MRHAVDCSFKLIAALRSYSYMIAFVMAIYGSKAANALVSGLAFHNLVTVSSFSIFASAFSNLKMELIRKLPPFLLLTKAREGVQPTDSPVSRSCRLCLLVYFAFQAMRNLTPFA